MADMPDTSTVFKFVAQVFKMWIPFQWGMLLGLIHTCKTTWAPNHYWLQHGGYIVAGTFSKQKPQIFSHKWCRQVAFTFRERLRDGWNVQYVKLWIWPIQSQELAEVTALDIVWSSNSKSSWLRNRHCPFHPRVSRLPHWGRKSGQTDPSVTSPWIVADVVGWEVVPGAFLFLALCWFTIADKSIIMKWTRK